MRLVLLDLILDSNHFRIAALIELLPHLLDLAHPVLMGHMRGLVGVLVAL